MGTTIICGQWPSHCPAPARATLIDFFHDATQHSGTFLVHDDGYRTRSFRYDEVGAARSAPRSPPARRGHRQGRRRAVLGREPAGVDRRVLGLPAARHRRRADRLPLGPDARRPHRCRRLGATAAGRRRRRGRRGATRRAAVAAGDAAARRAGRPTDRASRRRSRSPPTTRPRSSSPRARPPSPRA